MSGESATHARLVEALVRLVEERHRLCAGLVVFADHHSFGRDLPPRIGSHLPDVFACDVPAGLRLIGEAKTIPDLETNRSRRQLKAFLDHLSLYPLTAFYLAVPPTALARARYVLRSVASPEHGTIPMTVTSFGLC